MLENARVRVRRRPAGGEKAGFTPLADVGQAGSAPDASTPAALPQGTSPELARGRRRRRRRLLLVAPLLALILWAAVSYTAWMLAPTSEPFGARSVEWIRAKMPVGNQLVDEVEHVYYSWNAPDKGGPQLRKLPVVGLSERGTGGVSAKRARQDTTPPPPVRPVFPHPLPGEGQWKPVGPQVAGGRPILVTSYRPDVNYPRLIAYVGWFDQKRTAMAFYPGRYEPPHAAVRGPMMVPDSQRQRLLATFNAGFIYADGHNGSTDNGQVNEPLSKGNATLVGYRDGRIGIVDWKGGSNAGPGVAWTRQSLAPIVWNGRLNPELNIDPNSSRWGYTLGGVTRVWRTGVGVDRNGNLIYVAANDQTVISIAQILQHVGAVRAMEFDINPEWHTFITYSHRHGLDPRQIGPNPMQANTRYLVPDDRDFFAVYQRSLGPVTVPLR
jgi:hypothetical protein